MVRGWPLLCLWVVSVHCQSTSPVVDLIHRVFGPEATSHFQLELDPTCHQSTPQPHHGCFKLSDTSNNNVLIVASSLSELSYGVGWYVRYRCNQTVAFDSHLRLFTPKNWPIVGKTILEKRAVPYSYIDNVCTHSYSYVWFDQLAWQQHVDYMALSGINMFLAMTGQEEVQYKVFRGLGLNDTDVRTWFNGPAYLTWSRGQGMHYVGSPLPREWMQAQWNLQKDILKMARSLGLIPVLPAFQGNTPPQIRHLYPNANISNDSAVGWVSGTDPLFGHVADAWMKTLINDFGTDHWYQCDGFFTGARPPWYEEDGVVSDIESEDIDPSKVVPDPNWAKVWAGAWGGMHRTDPKAHWLYQGWAIRGWNNAAGASRIKALVDTVPMGQWILLDMSVNGIWKYFNNYSFFGAPFIWTTIHNMGGNDGLKGDFSKIREIPYAALEAKTSVIGSGTTPEGIFQNPIYYEYVYDASWSTTPLSVDNWFQEYPNRRYAVDSPHAHAAWKKLQGSVYTSNNWHDQTGVEWRPNIHPPTPPKFNLIDVYNAWQDLVKAATVDGVDYHNNSPFRYDVVNTGREVLAQLITFSFRNISTAVTHKDAAKAAALGKELLGMYSDLDTLLATDVGFLLGDWVSHARTWGKNGSNEDYYEFQAKSQVSTWWPVATPPAAGKWPPLDTYANKHWNGLVKDFYAARITPYLDQIAVDVPQGKAVNYENSTTWSVKAELAFTKGKKIYPNQPIGDVIHVSEALIQKYRAYFA